MGQIANLLLLYLVFLFSTACHEAAHSWAALRGGDSTAFEGGQVTIDPTPHIRRDPIGMVAVPLISVFTIGWPLGFASAPYNRLWAERHPQRAAWMSLAGPAANLSLALGSGVLINVGLFTGVFDAPSRIKFEDVTMAATGSASFWQVAAYLLGVVFALNLLLAVFNMLPLPPLDGSGAVALLLPEATAVRYQSFLHSNPGLGLLGIFVAWSTFGYVFEPVFTHSLNLLYFLHGTSYN